MILGYVGIIHFDSGGTQVLKCWEPLFHVDKNFWGNLPNFNLSVSYGYLMPKK
jgi:hypothetical protein